MTTLSRRLCAALLVAALLALATLLVADLFNQLQPTPLHQRAGAWAFILIGASNIALQFGRARFSTLEVKQALLGLGFILWGSAQLFPPGTPVVLMDCAVTLIFVMDLGWVILGELQAVRSRAASMSDYDHRAQ